MDNTLIFIISICIAGLLFTSFSAMVKKSAKAHREEEERERNPLAQFQSHQTEPQSHSSQTPTSTVNRKTGVVTYNIDKNLTSDSDNFSSTHS